MPSRTGQRCHQRVYTPGVGTSGLASNAPRWKGGPNEDGARACVNGAGAGEGDVTGETDWGPQGRA